MKAWQKALGDLRVVVPDTPKYREDVKLVWGYIEKLEKAIRHELGVTHGEDTIRRLRTALDEKP